MKFDTSMAFKEMTLRFFDTYQIETVFNTTISNKKHLKSKADRICRYCGLSMPDVTFKNNAHMIPEMLGNKSFFSDFECDSCNKLFGTYEDHFAKMLEPYRTLYEVKGKENKIPTFDPINENIRIESNDFFGKKNIKISRKTIDFKTFSFDKENEAIDINFDIHSFSPQKVYKFLLKLALSMIPDEEVKKDYQIALDYLLNKTNGKLLGGVISGYYITPTRFNTQVFLFRKKDSKLPTFTHFMALYTLNRIYTLPVTLNKNDFWFYGKKIKAVNYPPLFVGKSVDFSRLKIEPFYGIMSSVAKSKGKQKISIPIKNEEWVKVNPETNQILAGAESKFNVDEILEINLVEENTKQEEPSKI